MFAIHIQLIIFVFVKKRNLFCSFGCLTSVYTSHTDQMSFYIPSFRFWNEYGREYCSKQAHTPADTIHTKGTVCQFYKILIRSFVWDHGLGIWFARSVGLTVGRSVLINFLNGGKIHFSDHLLNSDFKCGQKK